MNLYAWHMTNPTFAAQELREAITGIMTVSDPSEAVFVTELSYDDTYVSVMITPSEAIELALWIRSHTEPSRDNPMQGTLAFTTE